MRHFYDVGVGMEKSEGRNTWQPVYLSDGDNMGNRISMSEVLASDTYWHRSTERLIKPLS